MEVLRGRRLFGILFVFTVSFCLCAVLPFYFYAIFAAVTAISFAVYCVVMKKRGIFSKYRIVYAALAVLMLAAGFFHAVHFKNAVPASFFSGEMEFSGKITEAESNTGYYGLYMADIEYDGKRIKALCESDFGADFEVGDSFVIKGNAVPLTEIYYKSKGARALISFSEMKITAFGEEKESFPVTLEKYFSSLLGKRLSGNALSLSRAMLLGEKNAVDGNIKLNFRRIGFSHVLAVSGLHITVLVFAFLLLLLPLPLSKRIKNLLIIPAVCIFIAVTGASASSVRAGIMFCIFALCNAFFADNDALTALMAALAGILIVSPSSVYDIGLWLSFSATLGIVVFSPALSPFRTKNTRKNYSVAKNVAVRVGNYIISLVLTSVVATAFTLPVVFVCYGNFSLLTPVASLVLIPAVQILLPLFLFVLIFGAVPIIAPALSFMCSALSDFIINFSDTLSSADGIYVSLRYPFGRYFILALLVLIFAFLFGKHIKFRRAAAAFAALAVSFFACVFVYEYGFYDTARAALINSAKNDAFIMKYGGRTVAIDISGGSYSFARSVAEEIYDMQSEKADILVYTHLHRYHAGTLEKLASVIKIKAIAFPAAQTEEEKEYADMISAQAERLGIDFYEYKSGAYIETGDIRINLPEYLRMERSLHRIPYFTIDAGDDRLFCYAGAGISELPLVEELTLGCHAVAYGSHGAVYKENVLPRGVSFALGYACDYAQGNFTYTVNNGKMKIIIYGR